MTGPGGESVAARLKRDLFAGVHPPGTALPSERVLARELGVARSAVREGIQKLEELGLVLVRHGARTRVLDFRREGGLELLPRSIEAAGTSFPKETLVDVLDFRVFYAAGIAELAAARATKGQVLGLERALLDLSLADDVCPWIVAERSFMTRLVEATRNAVFRYLQNTFAPVFKANASFAPVLFAHRRAVEGAYRQVLHAAARRSGRSAGMALRALMEKEARWLARA
jgi:DNA-binding FadR family transcriptional regulator